MKKGKSIRLLLWLTAVILALGGCSGQKETTAIKSGTYMYYLESDQSALYPVSYTLPEAGTEESVKDILTKLQSDPGNANCTRLIPENVTVQSISVDKGTIHIDFSSAYSAMDRTREVLVRAGVVRSLIQIRSVTGVLFTVNGSPAKDAAGAELGTMTEGSFVENARQLNAYQHVAIDLYFTDAEGDGLNIESRSIYYSSLKPLEWAIVERLIAGPKVEDNYPTVPANTSILSVTVSDGICYVNLGKTFVKDALNVSEQIPIYSVVDSICVNCPEVEAVQFSIEGDTDVTFRRNMALNKPYKPDLSYVNLSPEAAGSSTTS